MSFEIGTEVVISSPVGIIGPSYKGKRGTVTDYIEGEAFPYEVTMNGHSMGFAEDELSPVEGQGDEADEISHPSHYTWMPNGVEVIDLTELLTFNLGNVVKYVLRAGHKHDDPLTDLRKASWYINREILRLESI